MPDRLPASCRSRARYYHLVSINHDPMCQEWSIDLFYFLFFFFFSFLSLDCEPTLSRRCALLAPLLPLLHFPADANSIMRGRPTKVSRPEAFRSRHRAFHDVVTSAIAFVLPPPLPSPLRRRIPERIAQWTGADRFGVLAYANRRESERSRFKRTQRIYEATATGAREDSARFFALLYQKR